MVSFAIKQQQKKSSTIRAVSIKNYGKTYCKTATASYMSPTVAGPHRLDVKENPLLKGIKGQKAIIRKEKKADTEDVLFPPVFCRVEEEEQVKKKILSIVVFPDPAFLFQTDSRKLLILLTEFPDAWDCIHFC